MADRDRNLLFGVFAVQFKGVTPQQLVEVAAAWATDPSRDLPQMLVSAGYLSKPDCDRLLSLVDDAVRAHGGDSSAALETFGGQRQVELSFSGSIPMGRAYQATMPMPDDVTIEVDRVPSEAVDETPGRYTNPSEYARGGIGRVLLVHDQHLGRDIALKELLPRIDRDDSTMKMEHDSPVQMSVSIISRFLQEARITGQLEHPSIVPVYELGRRRNGALYYTMKLVRGKTFSAVLRESRTLTDRLRLLPHFADLCHAISYAHSRRVIHRDIKPGNVMVGEFGETVVLDWGLAKARDKRDEHAEKIEETLRSFRLNLKGKPNETEMGQVLGTPTFMPPEQARGELDLVNERSDVYSLGAVLYTMLTGNYPYDGESAHEILNKVLSQKPTPIHSIEPRAPRELVAICERAMDRDASKRYPSAKELAEDVSRFQSGALVQAYEYSFIEHLARFVSQHRLILGTVAFFLMAFAVFASYSYSRVVQEREQAIEARNQEEIQRRLAESYLYESDVDRAYSQARAGRFDLAKAALASAPQEFHGWEWDYLNALCHQDKFTIERPRRSIQSLAISPLGNLAAAGTSDGTLILLDPTSARVMSEIQQHSDQIIRIEFDPAGSQILTMSLDGNATIFDARNVSRFRTVEGQGAYLVCGCFSPDGSKIVIGDELGTVSLCNADDGARIRSIEYAQGRVADVRFNPNGAQFAALITDRGGSSLQVLPVNEGDAPWRRSNPPATLTSLAYSPDGKTIIVGFDNGLVEALASDASGEPIPFIGHTDAVATIVFDGSGDRFVTGSHDHSAILWHLADPSLHLPLDAHRDRVSNATFNDAGTFIATSSMDGDICLWGTSDGRLVRTYEGHSDSVIDVEFVPTQNEIVSWSEDGSIKGWDTSGTSPASRVVLTGHSSPVADVEFNPDGSSVLTRSVFDGRGPSQDSDQSVRTWNTGSGAQLMRIDKTSFFSATWNPVASQILTGGKDRTATLWDVSTGKELFSLAEHSSIVVDAVFSPDASKILTTSRDKTAALWQASDGQLLHKLVGHTRALLGGSFAPDGSVAATYGLDGSIRIWNCNSGQETAVLSGTGEPVNVARYFSDGVRLICGMGDGALALWDTRTGSEIRRFEGHTGAVWDLDLNPDERFVASASEDSSLRIWDIATGGLVHVCSGHSGNVWSVEYAPDGTRIVTAGEDETVRVWNALTGRQTLALHEHTAEVNRAVFSPDGNAIASASNDATAIVWRRL